MSSLDSMENLNFAKCSKIWSPYQISLILKFWTSDRYQGSVESRVLEDQHTEESVTHRLSILFTEFYSMNRIQWMGSTKYLLRHGRYSFSWFVIVEKFSFEWISTKRRILLENAAESCSLSLRDKCHATSMMLPFHLVVLGKVLFRAKSRFDLEKTRSTRSLL